MRLMLKRDPKWVFLIMEEAMFKGDDTMRSFELNAFSYAELFGSAGSSAMPFGSAMKVLANLADSAVGVPTGPFHLCMAKLDLPTIGLWIEHIPRWLEEPKPAAVHVLSRNLIDSDFMQRPGSLWEPWESSHQTMCVNTRVILGEQVLQAVEQLIG